MGKRAMAAVLSTFLVCFYMLIIMYTLFAAVPFYSWVNFTSAIFFEFIGFAVLLFFIPGNIVFGRIKIGYYVPVIIVTIIYTIILDVINMLYIITLPNVIFVLVNLVLLLIYGVIAVPMYVMGRG